MHFYGNKKGILVKTFIFAAGNHYCNKDGTKDWR